VVQALVMKEYWGVAAPVG